MKKFFLLSFVLLFLSSGCYDYIELNEMAIVSGISIDYEEEMYSVAFEILNTVSKDDKQNQPKVYIAKGKGNSISEAFSNTSFEIAKSPYLVHLKTVIINEEIAKEHVKEIIDFLIRDNHIRNIFYLAVAKDTKAFSILNATDANNPVVSTAIADLIESTTFTNNIASDLNFEQFVTNIIDPKKDTYLSSILIENDVLKLGPMAIFKEYNLQTYFDEDESATFNLMNGSSKEIHFKVNCPNDEENFIVLTTFNKPKSEIEIEQESVKISSEIETRIVENHCNMDFKKVDTYENIQKQVEEKLKENMEKVMKKSIEYDSDVLKINQINYQKNKKEIDFTKLNYSFDAKVIINRNGLIFEVEE